MPVFGRQGYSTGGQSYSYQFIFDWAVDDQGQSELNMLYVLKGIPSLYRDTFMWTRTASQ